jgi:cellobiose phosphorylase
VVPKSWRGFKVTRRFRGVTYRIAIERAGEGHRVALVVDGKPVSGDMVPPPADGRKEVSVKVTLT